MKRLLLVWMILLTQIGQNVNAQCVSAYKDNQDQYFYIFDGGIILQQEFLIPLEWKAGNDYVVYIDRNNNFKIYKYGFSETLQGIVPEQYWANDCLLTYINTGGAAYTLYGNKVYQLSPRVIAPLAVGDSVVAYRDNLDYFKIFYKGENIIQDIRSISSFWANENIVAYQDPTQQFLLFHQGETYTLTSTTPPRSFKIDRNVVAYVDYTGNFNIFYNGEVYEIEAFQPIQYEVGENMVAYITQNREFKVFYKGEIYDLSIVEPRSFELKENILVYVDQSNFFKVFYEGKATLLARYIPRSYKIDNDILVYANLDNYLLGFEYGKMKPISKEVVNAYELNNHSVFFYKVPTQMKMYCDDQIYPLF